VHPLGAVNPVYSIWYLNMLHVTLSGAPPGAVNPVHLIYCNVYIFVHTQSVQSHANQPPPPGPSIQLNTWHGGGAGEGTDLHTTKQTAHAQTCTRHTHLMRYL